MIADDLDTQWTHKTVKEALAEAFIVIERTTPRSGPRLSRSNWWAETTFEEVAAMRRLDESQIKYLVARDGQRRRPITPAEISQAEAIVFGNRLQQPWLQMLGTSPERVALELWAWREMRKEFGRPHQTIEAMCLMLRKAGMGEWSKATFDRRVSRGAYLIAARLNRASR